MRSVETCRSDVARLDGRRVYLQLLYTIIIYNIIVVVIIRRRWYHINEHVLYSVRYRIRVKNEHP